MNQSSPSPASVRVRIAPSPSGNLHVGTARAALFNYLFAKHHHGSFILRVEDTDAARSHAEYEQNIYEGLKALGLQWDEGPGVEGDYGPYKQSQRGHLYSQFADTLLQSGNAYYCYKTEAELEAERQEAESKGEPYRYKRAVATPEQEAQWAQDPNRKPVVRFAIDQNRPSPLVFTDLIRGDISTDLALMDDFVIMKSDGTPTYNFAVVVDDLTMAISHVIRGEDHISNTPKQILIYEALGKPIPQFAHASMILAPDRSKLSKRFGATAVADYVAKGYLPEALCNFLALLGWSPADEQEVKSLPELIEAFTLDRVSNHSAIFDIEKLNWLNGMYIRQLSPQELEKRILPYLTQAGWTLDQYTPDQRVVMMGAVQDGLHRLDEITDKVDYFFAHNPTIDPELKTTVLETEEGQQVLQKFQSEFLPTAPWDNWETMGEALKTFVKSLKPLKPKAIMWPIRVALTGRTGGADLGKTLWLLGEERIEHRLSKVVSTPSTP